MAAERRAQVTVTAVEPGGHTVEGLLGLGLIEGEDAGEHCSAAGVLVVEALLAGDEHPGDDPAAVGPKPPRAATDLVAERGGHVEAGRRCRACCRVASRARVDSVPW